MLDFNDNKVGKSHLETEGLGKPQQAADSENAVAGEARHMRAAVQSIVDHDKLMEDNPELHAKATAHVKKHGHKEAMNKLPGKPMKSLDEVREAANNMGRDSSEGGDYVA